jgi:UDP-GlcNAc:undecaprenyl-phosphate GlcNAc-1-phosphate transferase
VAYYFATVLISVAVILLFARLAPALGIVDLPGGRKAHRKPTPLVGGLGVFVSLLIGTIILGVAHHISFFLFALSVVIAAGLWDDVVEIPPRLKLLIQTIASAVMIWGAGIQLHSVGDIFAWKAIGLSVFAIPLTVFAIVGVVNSMNMMDGLDGLGGSVALTAFAWYAIVAADSGLIIQSTTALTFCCAIAGFLVLNLRFPWQPHALVFLGDAGSLMIGFALGWFAIDLAQGPGRTFPPIAALWVLLLPLADCVSLMSRRIAARKSPFVADSRHIHHYLMARGLTHSQTLAILVGCSAAFGAVGYFAWRLGVPDYFLFYPFFFGFFAYHLWITAAWKKVDQSRLSVETTTFAPIHQEAAQREFPQSS